MLGVRGLDTLTLRERMAQERGRGTGRDNLPSLHLSPSFFFPVLISLEKLGHGREGMGGIEKPIRAASALEFPIIREK